MDLKLGSCNKKFPAGEFGVGYALIIGQRKESTDLKTSLNDALRDFNVSILIAKHRYLIPLCITQKESTIFRTMQVAGLVY